MSIGSQSCKKYYDDNDDGNNENDSDVKDISAFFDSALTIVKNLNDFWQKKIFLDIDRPPHFQPIKVQFWSCIFYLSTNFWSCFLLGNFWQPDTCTCQACWENSTHSFNREKAANESQFEEEWSISLRFFFSNVAIWIIWGASHQYQGVSIL